MRRAQVEMGKHLTKAEMRAKEKKARKAKLRADAIQARSASYPGASSPLWFAPASRRRCRHCAAAVPPTTATVTSAVAATNQSGMHRYPTTGCLSALSALSLSSRSHPDIIFSFALSVFSFVLATILRRPCALSMALRSDAPKLASDTLRWNVTQSLGGLVASFSRRLQRLVACVFLCNACVFCVPLPLSFFDISSLVHGSGITPLVLQANTHLPLRVYNIEYTTSR